MKTKNVRKSYPALILKPNTVFYGLVSFLRYAALSASSSLFYVLLLMDLCFKENVASILVSILQIFNTKRRTD